MSDVTPNNTPKRPAAAQGSFGSINKVRRSYNTEPTLNDAGKASVTNERIDELRRSTTEAPAETPAQKNVTEKRYRAKRASSKKPARQRIQQQVGEGQRFNQTYSTPLKRAKKKDKSVKAKVSRFTSRRIIQVAMFGFMTWIWFIQIVLFAVLLVFFSAYVAISEVGVVGQIATDVAAYFGNEKAQIMQNFSMGFVLLPALLTTCITLICLFAALTIFKGKPGLKPLSTPAKEGLFMLAFIGYAIPFVNVLPWAMPWLFELYRHPDQAE